MYSSEAYKPSCLIHNYALGNELWDKYDVIDFESSIIKDISDVYEI